MREPGPAVDADVLASCDAAASVPSEQPADRDLFAHGAETEPLCLLLQFPCCVRRTLA